MKVTAALMVLVSLTPFIAHAQEWTAYQYPDPGFAIQFPVPPKVETSSVKGSAGAKLPLTRYTAEQDQTLYTLSVADYSATSAEAMPTIAETEKALSATGKVTVAIDARVNRSFGRELSVNGPDGSRSTIAIFFVNKHLYTLIGKALPPNAIAKSGDTIRFQESLQFIGANGGFGGGLGGPGGGRGRGGFNPQAQAACMGKSAGDAVQLDTPRGSMPATCTLVARPNRPPDFDGGTQAPNAGQTRPPTN